MRKHEYDKTQAAMTMKAEEKNLWSKHKNKEVGSSESTEKKHYRSKT